MNAELTRPRTRVWSGGSVWAMPTAKFSWSAANAPVSQPGIRSITRVTRSALEKRRVSRIVVSMSSARVSSQQPQRSTQWTGDSSRKPREDRVRVGDEVRRLEELVEVCACHGHFRRSVQSAYSCELSLSADRRRSRVATLIAHA